MARKEEEKKRDVNKTQILKVLFRFMLFFFTFLWNRNIKVTLCGRTSKT